MDLPVCPEFALCSRHLPLSQRLSCHPKCSCLSPTVKFTPAINVASSRTVLSPPLGSALPSYLSRLPLLPPILRLYHGPCHDRAILGALADVRLQPSTLPCTLVDKLLAHQQPIPKSVMWVIYVIKRESRPRVGETVFLLSKVALYIHLHCVWFPQCDITGIRTHRCTIVSLLCMDVWW